METIDLSHSLRVPDPSCKIDFLLHFPEPNTPIERGTGTQHYPEKEGEFPGFASILVRPELAPSTPYGTTATSNV